MWLASEEAIVREAVVDEAPTTFLAEFLAVVDRTIGR